jgi:peptide/nickel transport system substrate-binding protein
MIAATTMLATLALPATPSRAKDDLAIAMNAAPPGLHPYINGVAVKTYVLDFGTRPITALDKNMKRVCVLFARTCQAWKAGWFDSKMRPTANTEWR